MYLLDAAFGIVAVILLVLFAIMYNALVTLRNNVNKAWSNIDVLLEKRHDLIGKLVDTVKGYMKYEKTVLVEVTEMRTAWADVQGSRDRQAKIDASNDITDTLRELFADVEGYPELKADQAFAGLQKALVEIENEIADRREFYNDSVNEFNIKMQVVPYSLFSRLLGYAPLPFFKADGEARKPVKRGVAI